MITIRTARKNDIDWIVHHRIEMFRSMGRSESELSIVEQYVRNYLAKSWDDNLIGFLAVEHEKIVGGGVISVWHALPTPRNPTGGIVYLHNVFVEPAYRRRGIASALLQHVIEYARQIGFHKIELERTPMGQHVYERAGFVKTEDHHTLGLDL